MLGRLVTAVMLLLACAVAQAAAHGTVTHIDPPGRDAFALGDLSARSGGPSIPDTWCGETGAADDTLHEHPPLDVPKIRVGLVYGAGQPFAQKDADLAQNHARLMLEHLRAETGDRKSLRFDLGTRCGPGYLDLTVMHIPPLEAPGVEGSGKCPNFDEVRSAMNPRKRPVNLLAFILLPECSGGGGMGESSFDDRAGPANDANVPGRLATNFGDRDPMISLHEIGHTLGAVQLTALHNDGNHHCWDHADIMCYPYTSLAPQSAVRPCAFAEPLDPFDCNKDDYFNVDPAPGSYLATHWNLFDSVFMCPAHECLPSPPPPAPPASSPAGPVPVSAPPAPAAKPKPATKRRPGKRCKRARTRAARKKHRCPAPKRRAKRLR